MKAEKDLISVIVPVYNVASYLPKCIKSIMNQTYSNLEIIFIDDGSTDECPAICDEYKSKDTRIKVIHKRNGGITTSRKAGAQIAQGKYIGFIDGDDWIEKNMYEELSGYAKRDKAQIVLSGMYRDNEKGTYVKWNAANISVGRYSKNNKEAELCTKLFSNGSQNVNGSLNNKLFEAQLLKRNLEKVDNRIHGFADDTVCLFPCLLEADTVTIIEEAYYHGVDRAGSATQSRNDHWFEQLNLVFFRLRDVFQTYSYKEILLQQLQAYIINSTFEGVEQLFPDLKAQKYFWINDTNKIKKKIIIYGAGKVGQSYFLQFQKIQSVDVVLWVDTNAEQYRKKGLRVSDIDCIYEQEYDEIIIALKNRVIAENIKTNLIQSGINKEKILWKEPVSFYEYVYKSGR